ncbi:MAG: ribosome small subunit-dependent GTPase A [Deltaproteobacteria bacterium RIFOXYD12_FULL_50_9]|nr:MAG: ribosome small subunit-dependent GTPase A [Deltaproteobacteria bacterium RIFOXYD12_FULL_50_9]
MDFIDLGFDSWFEDCATELHQPDYNIARVTAVDRSGGLIRNENGEVSSELAGKLRFSVLASADLPCVGDWVFVQYHNDGELAIIHGVFPRKTFLRRKCAGKTVDFQMIAANIDIAFIVQSCHYDFNLRRFERYLVMANEGRIEPILVLTKTDLITKDELEKKVAAIRESGITTKILTLSNTTGAGLDELRQFLVTGKTYCLLGSSGVGKTTIINRLVGRDEFSTKAVSGTGEGIHTTARRQLILLDKGGMFIDTPGMRELGILASSDVIEDSFNDIHGMAMNCQYANCSHIRERGCSVLEAVENGSLSEDRYKSYLKLKKESEFYELSYVEKRKKDKAFGKFVKLAKSQLKK